jgi:hypothetical protein
MVVSVMENNSLYMLADSTKMLSSSRPGEESGWVKLNVPEIGNGDEGKLLTVVSVNVGTTEKPVYKYEAQWIEAPSGLPDMESEDGKFLTVVKDETTGNYVAQWIDVPNELPTISEEEDGKFLTVEKDTTTGNYIAKWINVPDELPAISEEVANKILQVKSDGSGVMWVDTPDELPTFTSSDTGKVLTITSNGSKIEWKTITHPDQLPVKTNNELKFLQVSADGKSVQWADPLPPVLDEFKNNSFLGTDFLGRITWKPYQHRATYDELMMLVGKGHLVPGGTYILGDYFVPYTPINAVTNIGIEFYHYMYKHQSDNPINEKLFQVLKSMNATQQPSLVDIVLRADSTNSFERKAKMITKSREYISEIVQSLVPNVIGEDEAETIITTFVNMLPKINAEIEIEMNPSKLEIDDCVIYGLSDDSGNIFPNFKGVITYMKDSFGNEMPFDFKTVLVGEEGTESARYIFTDNYKPMADRASYICQHNLSNTGKMRDVRLIIDDEYYSQLRNKITTNQSIYDYVRIDYHSNFNQVANIGDFNSGSNTFINNVEIHNNPFFIKDTLINGLKIFNDDKGFFVRIVQDVESIMSNTQGMKIYNILNASLILNNVTLKNSAQILSTLYDNVGMNGISFTFPVDPWTGKATQLEIRKILRNITIDLPNDFSNYRLLMNGEYLTNFDAMPGDYPTICAYDHMIEISRQMAELIKSKSNQLELTSETYKNDLNKQGGHNNYNENLIKTITNTRYVSMMAPLSFGEFLEFKYPTTDTSGGETPVFTLLNLLRDAEKTYRLVINPNGELVFKLQVPQFDNTTATSVVELGI